MESFFNTKSLSTPKNSQKELSIEGYTILKVIGMGSYGKVFLVQKNEEIYAMKVLLKKHIIKYNQVENIKSERKILEIADHPFIIKLRYAFQTANNLYLIMDYCPGGDLFYHIKHNTRFNEEAVKFYSAQLVLAIDYLHQSNILYRDLKPENVLISKTGYIQLIDFGLSKENAVNDNSEKTLCGTSKYLAPEMINSTGYGKSIDWWSLGSIIFEMLVGVPAFRLNERHKLFESITNDPVKFPSYLSKEAVDIITKLLTKNPNKRLGSGSNGINDIKDHDFYKTIQWDDLLQQKIKPIFIPQSSNKINTKYIDDSLHMKNPEDNFVDNTSPSTDDSIIFFEDFSYP